CSGGSHSFRVHFFSFPEAIPTARGTGETLQSIRNTGKAICGSSRRASTIPYCTRRRPPHYSSKSVASTLPDPADKTRCEKYLSYAQGWLALGKFEEAANALDGIPSSYQHTVPVLAVRCEHSLAARQWASAASQRSEER